MDLPKIYLIAFLVAAVVHVVFLRKVEVWEVAYKHRTGEAIETVNARVTLEERPFRPDEVRDVLRSKLSERGPAPDGVVLLHWARIDVRWRWALPWRR
jgi:hypothetical protein